MKKCFVAVCLLVLLLLFSADALAQRGGARKNGLDEADWVYKLGDGVTTKEITFYSEGIGCYGKIFFPKGFNVAGKTPGIVLGQGWAGTHFSIEKYANRFAEKGLVAMVIDYRGWGSSDGYLLPAKPTVSYGDKLPTRDETRFTKSTMEVTQKRTRLVANDQVQDYRNAISFLQGEPGVDRDRIGIWGSSYAGGHVVTVAGLDGRVKALVAQIPAITGQGSSVEPRPLAGAALTDAITRAREGQGGQVETGFSVQFRRNIDRETDLQLRGEYRPFNYIPAVAKRPALIVAAQNDELCALRTVQSAFAELEKQGGPKKIVVVPGITHFEMYINDPFEVSSNAAADWFLEHLK